MTTTGVLIVIGNYDSAGNREKKEILDEREEEKYRNGNEKKIPRQ